MLNQDSILVNKQPLNCLTDNRHPSDLTSTPPNNITLRAIVQDEDMDRLDK